MLFNSFTYAFFLPLVAALCLILTGRTRRLFLLAASYTFYCWTKPVYGILILSSTLIDFCCGLWIAKAKADPARRLALACSIVANLGLLFFFKYADFFGSNITRLAGLLGLSEAAWQPLELLLPIGISFYTFQTMSYTIQVYRRQIQPTRDFFGFALYVSFFPQLVAGPIERASDLLPQLLREPKITLEDIEAGMTRIVFGLFRKMVLADRFAIIVNRVYADPEAFSTADAWMAAFAFFAQVYFDFAGYSDIAIGSARLFGIRLSENFHRPMVAISKSDFWGRWHLTLTRWLRENLFIPLGGFRRGWRRSLLNGWTVLLLCGLWHGAAWNFVIWGAAEAAVLSLYYFWRAFKRKHLRVRSVSRGTLNLKTFLSIGLTFVVSSLCTICFRSPNLATIGAMLRSLAGVQRTTPHPMQWDVPLFAILLGTCLAVELLQEYASLNQRIARLPSLPRLLLLSMVAVATAILAVSSARPYIYFRF